MADEYGTIDSMTAWEGLTEHAFTAVVAVETSEGDCVSAGEGHREVNPLIEGREHDSEE